MSKKKREKNRVQELKKEIEKRNEKIRELEEKLLYLRAEFENYRKYIEKEKKHMMEEAKENIIKSILPVIDDLERAVESLSDEQSKNGIEMILKNFLKILEGYGLKRMNCLGNKFDPNYHEAVMSEESDKEDGTVLEEFQKGYILGSRVIRHAKVKIAKNKNT